jgi:hypothetical protein
VYSANRLFFRHPPQLNSTTTNSGQRLCSLPSCIFLGNCLDRTQSALAGTGALTTNPMVIHRFNTFLGMTALGNRSEVSYLSRGRGEKDGSVEWGKRSSDHITRPGPNGWPRHSIRNYQARSIEIIDSVRGASGRLHHRAGVRTSSLMPRPSINVTLANLDLDGFRLCLHGFRKVHVKHPVFEIRGHLAPVRILRK